MKKYLLPIILIVYLALGGLYATLTPAWQAPDEPAHYNYVRYLAENQSLPELTMGCYNQSLLSNLTGNKFRGMSVDAVCYENYQPPLYYLLAAPIFAATGGNLLALRLFSVLLGGLSLIAIFRAANTFLPLHLSAATTAFVAFVPMHLTMLASVNNDSLAELLLALFVFLLLKWVLQHHSDGAKKTNYVSAILWMLGVVLGLILLTKVTVYSAIVIGAVGLWLAAPGQWRTLVKNALRLYLPALALALPMLVRNALVYGGLDVLGLARHDSVVVGQLRTADRLADTGWLRYLSDLVRTTFHSFWGQFGWMAVPMDSRVYLALTVFSALALVGFALWWWRARPIPTHIFRAMILLVTQLLLVTVVFSGLNLSFVQFQGRYFFSALLPLGVFFSLGMNEVLRRKPALVGAGVSVLLLAGMAFSVGVDKWGLLIAAGTAVGLTVRYWLPEALTDWLLVAIFGGLATLAGASVFWFIVPNL